MRQTTKARRLELLDRAIAEQEAWVATHGATLSGYVARYGSPARPDCTRWPDGYYGSGGEAIYAADTNELYRLRDERAALRNL